MESDSESIRNLPKSLSFIESARRVFFKIMGPNTGLLETMTFHVVVRPELDTVN